MWLTNAVVVPAAVMSLRLAIVGPAAIALAMTGIVPFAAAIWWFLRARTDWREWAFIWPVLGGSLGFGVGIFTLWLKVAGGVAVLPWALAAIATGAVMALPRPTPAAFARGGMLIAGFPVAAWVISAA
jgi:hypothetical protein